MPGDQRNFRCAACSEEKSSLPDMMDHVSTKHKVTRPSQVCKYIRLPSSLIQWTCWLCVEAPAFSCKDNLFHHLQFHHGPFFTEKARERGNFHVSCRLCDATVGGDEENAKSHLEKQHQLNMFYRSQDGGNSEAKDESGMTNEEATKETREVIVISDDEVQSSPVQPTRRAEGSCNSLAALHPATRRFSKIVAAQRPSPGCPPKTRSRVNCIVCGKKVAASYVQRHIYNIHALSVTECRRLHGKLFD